MIKKDHIGYVIANMEHVLLFSKRMTTLQLWNKSCMYLIDTWVSEENLERFKLLRTYRQWRRHGVDWGGFVPPISHRGQFSNSSKSDEKLGGGGVR